MWGNKQGWILSALIAVFMSWTIWKYGRPAPPTPPSGQFSYLTTRIELPTKPEAVHPVFTEKRDAGDAYWQASQVYLSDKKTYDNFFTPKQANFKRLEHLAEVEPAMKLLIEGTNATDAKIFIRKPELLVNYDYPYHELDGLYQLGRIAGQIGLSYAAKGSFEDAAKYYDAEFSLGKKLFDERINSSELFFGIGLLRESSSAIARLADKQNDGQRKAKFETLDQQLKDWYDTRFDKLNRVVSSIDTGDIKKYAGDVMVLATESPERVWRVEALLKLGRYKFNAGTKADQVWAERYLSEPARVGKNDPAEDPDPAVKTAARIARDLTLDGFNQIRLTD